jgi:putative redox protein
MNRSTMAAATAVRPLTNYCWRHWRPALRWQLGSIHVDARFSRDDCGLENIERTITFGNTLTPEQLQRLAEICEKTPVTKTLREGTPISTALS